MMTEDDAIFKWCPKTQVTTIDGEFWSNRETFSPAAKEGFDLCIGSDCMAWRWNLDEYPEYNETQEQFQQRRKGYCGLAGK